MNAEFVNLKEYPVDQPDLPDYQALVREQRQRLASDGIVVLPDFLAAAGIDAFKREINDRLDTAFHAVSRRHPYGYTRSNEFPNDHPRNTFGPTESYRLARHLLERTRLDALYCWAPMRHFIAGITGHPEIFLSGDPSNGLVVQVYQEHFGQAWHFDQALFSTILNLAESEAGGVFECVPNLRTEDDPNYLEVKEVLDARSDRIRKHKVKAGSFTVMLGRYTMHRVTPVEGRTPRISAVLSYELAPGVHMDLATRKASFGPTTPELP